MTGVYQVYNSILAADTARVIDSFDDSFNISEEHIKEGLKNARWRGRFEKIQSNPPVYVDGAHNEGGWLSLAENIKAYFKDKHIIYICGVLADKEYHKMIKILSPYSNEMIVLTPDNSRGLSSSSLQNAASKYFTNIYQAEDVLSAKKMAEKMASGYDDPVILIFGSLSFIGQLYD
jgi:dihydrofolate synthase/folylpolyglutamate synthase